VGPAASRARVGPSGPALGGFAHEMVVCDRDGVGPGQVSALPAPAIGFYSHVDVETRDRGREAGLDLVVPRSRMARELPGLAERLLA